MKALVLSGGGSKGAWQVGALKYLLGDLETEYEILAGTSVGALNCGYLAHYGAKEAKLSIEGLVSIWNEFKPKHIKKSWYCGLLGDSLPFILPAYIWKIPFLGKPSLYNSKPLQKMVRRVVDPLSIKTSGRILRVGAVSLTTGERRIWTEQDNDIAEAILASSSYPAAFLPIEIDGELYSDDGLRQITPLEEAILAGATDIDVLICQQEGIGYGYSEHNNGLATIKRIIDVALYEVAVWDIRAGDLYPHVNVRILRPRKTLSNGLNFSRAKIDREMKQGYEDVQDASAWSK